MERTTMGFHVTITITVCLLLVHLPAAQSRSPEAQLKAAQHKEHVEGDLEGAIELYKQVSARRDAGRQVAAEALLGLAQSYEKLGAVEARAVYEQIIRNYSDQGTVAATARSRVTAMEGTPSRGLLARQLLKLSSNIATLALLSDGRIGATDWSTGDLVVIEPANGAITRVVEGDFDKANTWAEDPVLSPDRRHLAYLWFSAAPSEDKGVLRVLPMEKGARPRTLVADPQMRNIVPLGWSGDSRAVLVSYEKPVPANAGRPEGQGDFDLAWVSIDSGTVKPIRSFEWWRSAGLNSIGPVGVSPGGRWIAYAVPDRQGTVDRSIFVMRADGSGLTRLVTGGVNDYPVWTPDGSRLVFLSTRSGDPALWSVDVAERGDAAPTLIKNGMGRVILYGMLPSGVLVYSEAGVDPLIVAETDRPFGSAAQATLRTVQTLNGLVPSWSPDGRHLAYKRRTINPSRPVEMVVQTLDTGELRTYSPRTGTMGMGQPTWHADGTVQAVTRSGIRLKVGPDSLEELPVAPSLPMGIVSIDGRTIYANAANGGIEAFDVSNGARTASIPVPNGWRAAALSPDGRTLALRKLQEEQGEKLALVNVDGTGFRAITTSFRGSIGREVSPRVAWTRDGSALLVSASLGNDRSVIYRLPLDGGPVVEVANLYSLRAFAISPDERRIAYSTDRPSTDVWTLDLRAALK